MDRRAFLTSAAVFTAATAAAAQRSTHTRVRHRIKAVAFDGFPIIDSRPIAAKVEELFPGKGDAADYPLADYANARCGPQKLRFGRFV